MVDYKRILRLRAEGVSQRGIADVMGCSRNTVSAVFTAAGTAGIGFEQVADLGAGEVRHLLLPEPVKAGSRRAAVGHFRDGGAEQAAVVDHVFE
jgi:hypothetical protein